MIAVLAAIAYAGVPAAFADTAQNAFVSVTASGDLHSLEISTGSSKVYDMAPVFQEGYSHPYGIGFKV